VEHGSSGRDPGGDPDHLRIYASAQQLPTAEHVDVHEREGGRRDRHRGAVDDRHRM